jgi:limonene-1,2-epoxide hydrolase
MSTNPSPFALLENRLKFMRALAALAVTAVAGPALFGALAHADGPQPRRGKGHAEDIVLDTLEAFGTLNVDNIVRYFSPDILYQSTGFPDLVGLQAARDYIAPFMSVFSVIDYQVTNVLSQDGIVSTERVENYVVSPNSPIGTPGAHMVLPVAGWCEVRRGLIVRWSDYYNQYDVTRQTGIPTGGS